MESRLNSGSYFCCSFGKSNTIAVAFYIKKYNKTLDCHVVTLLAMTGKLFIQQIMNSLQILIIYMSIYLCGSNTSMPQQSLNGSNISSLFYQSRSKTMTKCMWSYFLFYSSNIFVLSYNIFY